jgi:SAM-dependent methyltransferase
MSAARERYAYGWQLDVFQRSLKKRLKLQALLEMLDGDLRGKDCLLVTCGDNNGALNWHFRDTGGRWIWADIEGDNLAEMADFLDEPVYHVAPSSLPFEDATFDLVVSIDTLEHLSDDQSFVNELRRTLRPGGQALITVPNGDPQLPANRVKRILGMTSAVYGHSRAGYTMSELRTCIGNSGLIPVRNSGYSRFFTEVIELVINYGYVFVLSRQDDSNQAGKIAPTSSSEMKQHGLAYKIYAVSYPILRAVSLLDRLLPESNNHAVIVGAVRPGISR